MQFNFGPVLLNLSSSIKQKIRHINLVTHTNITDYIEDTLDKQLNKDELHEAVEILMLQVDPEYYKTIINHYGLDKLPSYNLVKGYLLHSSKWTNIFKNLKPFEVKNLIDCIYGDILYQCIPDYDRTKFPDKLLK